MFLNEQLEIVGHRHFIIRVPVFWGLLIVKKFHIMHNFFFLLDIICVLVMQ